MILILSHAEDPTAKAVASRLQARGVRYLRFDPADYPARAHISFARRDRGWTATLTTADGTCRLEEVRAGWLRRPGQPAAAAHVTDADARSYIAYEAKDFLDGLWDTMSHIAWCPLAPGGIGPAQLKLKQLHLATALGFSVPDTLMTNVPGDFVAFAERLRYACVTKLTSPTAFQKVYGTTHTRYTEPLSPHDGVHTQNVALAPITLQAYVKKRVELRVIVVGDELFTAAIDSQSTQRTRHDWRRYDHRNTRYTNHELPDDVAARCLAFVRAYGLSYAALDLIVTPDNEYVFLECNPGGEYLWLEERLGFPISDSVATLLTRTAQGEA